MKLNDINIRDPFILIHQDKYYMYGTRGQCAWDLMDGFDCHVSDDLVNWSDAIEIFHNDGSFWADRCYWAPECYFYKDAFYLIATFKSETRHMGVQILRADSPTGPFRVHSLETITPLDWECLDGTLHVDAAGKPHLIFSRSFTQSARAPMCAVPLKDDLSGRDGEIMELFFAADAPWVGIFPFAKEEFGIDDDCYLSDGPYLYRTQSGRLIMLWSSFKDMEYCVGLAVSDGELYGNWTHIPELFYNNGGGHGMLFKTLEGELKFAVHCPNDKGFEKPIFLSVIEENNLIKIEGK